MKYFCNNVDVKIRQNSSVSEIFQCNSCFPFIALQSYVSSFNFFSAQNHLCNSIKMIWFTLNLKIKMNIIELYMKCMAAIYSKYRLTRRCNFLEILKNIFLRVEIFCFCFNMDILLFLLKTRKEYIAAKATKLIINQNFFYLFY